LLPIAAGITIAAINTTKNPTTAKPLLSDEAVVPAANTAAEEVRASKDANTFFILLIFYFLIRLFLNLDARYNH
jgi:hypothetical protein